jgi:hypothetical protein
MRLFEKATRELITLSYELGEQPKNGLFKLLFYMIRAYNLTDDLCFILLVCYQPFYSLKLFQLCCIQIEWISLSR